MPNLPGLRLVTTLATLCLAAPAPAHARGHRYAHEVPEVASIAVDSTSIGGGIALNERIVRDSDFAPGRGKTFGGDERAYVGANQPFVGDFNGDGRDDVGVRWTGGVHAGRWTISLNDKNGNFLPGKGVTFGGTVKAYLGDNRLFTGDFNGDGYDDIGVQWKSGPHAGRWTISLNDKKGNFLPGKGVTFGGTVKAYVGSNQPIAGDFDGDGYDDLGVRWTAGPHAGQWTVSRNDRKGNFEPGVGRRFGGALKAYVGSNQPIIGDFNGDGRDDVGVRWTGGTHKYHWTVSLNDGQGHFEPGRRIVFGNVIKAYAGSNLPVVGDFDGDRRDDIGVKWIAGTHNGRWVFSRNQRGPTITRTRKFELRIPVVFVNTPGEPKTTDAQAVSLLAEVRTFFLRSTHGRVDLRFRHRIVELSHDPTWKGGVPDPVYAASGQLLNGSRFPSVREYAGYWCRFPFPGKGGDQIIFKNANGNLEWFNNRNIHRNYCQVAERNFAKDSLAKWASADPSGFASAMSWASSGSKGPMFAMMARGMPGGGNRTLQESVNKAWPLTIGGQTFTDYIYLDQNPTTLAHEIGHMLGHPAELYANKSGTQCASANDSGYLGRHAMMGDQYAFFPAFNGVNRWRFGFAEARYVTRDEGTVTLTLPRALSAGGGRSVIVVHPDPAGHPDEVFLIENRGEVSVGNHSYDRLPNPGMYVYRVKGKNRSPDRPLIDLLEVPSKCPGELVPHQSALTPTTNPALRFHDGQSAKFQITGVKTFGTNLQVTIRFL